MGLVLGWSLRLGLGLGLGLVVPWVIGVRMVVVEVGVVGEARELGVALPRIGLSPEERTARVSGSALSKEDRVLAQVAA